MPRILVTNDDGVHGAGIRALASALETLGEVTIVAPAMESSAVGHALTLIRPLRLERIGERVYSVDGTPTDCVNLAVVHVLNGKPDLVVSGINTGYNLGDDVTYSGTVAGAMEAALAGVPGIAVSLCRSKEYDFTQAADVARRMAAQVLTLGLPPRTFLNINVPRQPAKGLRATVQALRTQSMSIRQSEDPRGKPYYWIDDVRCEWDGNPQSDFEAVQAGFVSVTPLQLDLTAHRVMGVVEAMAVAASER
jgi:5'-nucleotidase